MKWGCRFLRGEQFLFKLLMALDVGRNFCENFVLDNKNFQSGKNFEVENF
jgi:hypothetical protein